MKSKGAPSKSKTERHVDYNWDCLSRDDIYRQRVLGTESGASQFIQTDDKKQLSLLSMIIYILLPLGFLENDRKRWKSADFHLIYDHICRDSLLFCQCVEDDCKGCRWSFRILSAMNFVWKDGVIESKFEVTRAVEQWVSNRHFDITMTPKSFEDIDDIGHIQDWLRYALPIIISPPAQAANFPLRSVRFSLRNVQQINNTEQRFNQLAQALLFISFHLFCLYFRSRSLWKCLELHVGPGHLEGQGGHRGLSLRDSEQLLGEL